MTYPAKDTGIKLTANDIHRYRERLNGMNFTRAMGWHWTIARRDLADGSSTALLNRVDRLVHDGLDTPRQGRLDRSGNTNDWGNDR